MDWQPIVNNIAATAAPYVGAVLVGLVSIGLKRLNDWIRARVESERMKAALVQVTEAVGSTVMDIEATTRRFMTDGKLSPDEQTTLRNIARDRIRQQIPQALDVLTRAGLGDLDAYIAGKIEAAVVNMPKKIQAGTTQEAIGGK